MKHSAQTRITGVVVYEPRCHGYDGGVVANVTVDVSIGSHTERYQCVAFGDLGAEIQNTVSQGDIVSATGYMKTSPRRDDPNKENHQLIAQEFVVEVEATKQPARTNDHSPQRKQKQSTQGGTTDMPKQLKHQRRQYGRGVKKQRQDFTVLNRDPEPFNDILPF